MANEDVRTAIKKANLKYWKVASKLNMNDSQWSRKLRFELTSEEKQHIYEAIQHLQAEERR